jgi:hypothetical protein
MEKRQIRTLTHALAAIVATALVLAAVAVAAAPKDGTYGGPDISLTVKSGKITEVTGGAGFKCNAVPLDSKKTIAVKKGKFHFSGKVNNVVGKPEGKLTLSGKFNKASTKATGTYKFVKGSCTNKKKFTATLGGSVG